MAITERELLNGYAAVDPYRMLLEARIRSLLKDRRWWRENRWADWPDIRHDGETELRALVRLAREARRVAALSRPVDAYRAAAERGLSYHDAQAR